MECYLSRNYREINSAGNKAKTDMEAIMRAMGLRNVGLPQSRYRDPVRHFFATLASVAKSSFCLCRGDTLVLQYPLKKYYEVVCDMAHARGAKVVTLVHDLGCFRRKALTVEREIRRLNHSDVVIALNDSMKAWLEERGCRAKLFSLGVWDYLSPEVRLLLTTGLCGGFTTFSTFSNEGLTLFKGGHYIEFTAYLVLSLTLGILAALAGGMVGHAKV